MEPMTLGSPVSSPVFSHFPSSNLGINTAPSSNVGSSYYPSYLMGETQTSLSSRMPPGSISPGRRARQFSASAGLVSPNSPQLGGRENFFSSTRIGGERQGGPPIVSLMGGLPQSPVAKHHSASVFIDQQRNIATPTSSLLHHNPTAFSTPVNVSQSSVQNFSPYTPNRDHVIGMCSETIVESQGSEPLEDTWVTVYGFPVASASYILTQFAQLGTIIDQRQPGLGNWMHLKYQTKLQTRKALTKNGKIFNGSIMIGVVPCTDLSITGGNKENISLDQSGIFSPRNSPLPTTPRTPKAHMRPLVQAYNASRSEIEVTPTSNTPKKNDSLVSKAIQHILGV